MSAIPTHRTVTFHGVGEHQEPDAHDPAEGSVKRRLLILFIFFLLCSRASACENKSSASLPSQDSRATESIPTKRAHSSRGA